MESQILEDITYTSLVKSKSRALDIDYVNTHNKEKVVPLDLVLSVLKDIELRMEYMDETNSDMEKLYQDI